MEKQALVESAFRSITILDRFDDDGPQEERFSGFLTSSNHAMYVEQKYGALMIVEVEPTNDPSVYLTVSSTMELGRVDETAKNAETVEAVAKTLNNMTAYEFVAKVMLKLRHEVDFEDKITPVTPATLESEVANT